MSKPKFDPTQPYEPVDTAAPKPKFDPTQAYESAEPGEDLDSETAPTTVPANLTHQPRKDKVSMGDAGLRAAAQGFSLGTIDEVTAGAGAAYDYAFDNPYGADLGDIYNVKHDRISGADKMAKEDRPWLYHGTEFAAGMAVPVGALGKLKKVKDLSNAKKGTVVGAATGGITGAGYGERDKKVGSATTGFIAGGFLGGLFTKFGEKVGKAIAKRLGVGDDSVNLYMKDKDGVKGTKFDEAQEAFEAPIKKFQENISGTADELTNTRQALEGAKNRAHATKLALRQEASEEAYRSGEAARKARQLAQQELDKVNVPHDIADDIAEGLGNVRKSTSALAKEQTDYLTKQKHRVDLSDLTKVFKGAMAREKIAGVDPNTENSKRIKEMQGLLNSVRRRHLDREVRKLKSQLVAEGADADPAINKLIQENRVEELIDPEQVRALLDRGNKVSPDVFMKLRQTIGNQIDAYAQNHGSYTKRSDALGKRLQKEINSILDAAPGGPQYQAIRGRLADETNLSNKLSKSFGAQDPDQLVKTLRSLADPNNASKMELLRRLDRRSGGKIMPKIQPYLDAQAKRQNKPELSQMLDSLPESQSAVAAQARRRGLPQELSSLPEVKEAHLLDNRAALLSQKQKALKDSANDYRSLGMQGKDVDSQGAIRKLMFRNEATKPETRLVEAAKRVHGDDILDKIGYIKAKAEFEGGTPNGSRLATLFGDAGSAVGGLKAGPAGSKLGRFGGSWLGAGVDYTKGKTAQKALDIALSERMPLAKGTTLLIGQNINKLVEMAQINPEADKYLTVLDKAAERGPTALISAHQTLAKEPGFRKFVEDTDG